MTLSEAVVKVSPRRREVAERILMEGEKAKEVGEDLGIAEKTVRRHRELAQEDLRRVLEDERLEGMDGGSPSGRRSSKGN